jgi:hypothetical protein
LATGLNRWQSEPNGQGRWVPAVAEFEPSAEGYLIARQTQTQVILPPDLAQEPVDLLGPDGATRQWHVAIDWPLPGP